MRASGKPPKPTAAEMDILGVLWDAGPATVRQVHAALEASRSTGYTTVLKLMQIMAEKGLLERDERERAHVYRAVVGREQTRSQVLAEVAGRLFGGSAARLALHALSHETVSKDELDEIRRLLERHEGREAE